MTSMTRGRRTAVVAESDLMRNLPAERLGPGSVYWYITGDWRTLLIAFRALVYQTPTRWWVPASASTPSTRATPTAG